MKIYVLNHFNYKKYIFIPIINDDTNSLITKLISNTISNEELIKLGRYYDYDLTKLEGIKDYIIYKISIEDYSIIDLKKHIFVLLDIPIYKQHLYIQNNSLKEDKWKSILNRNRGLKITDLYETLGYKYSNEEGVKIYDPELFSYKTNDPLDIEFDHSDILTDTHSFIIRNYDILYNEIFLIDYDSFKKIKNSGKIEHIYYPKIKNINYDELPINKENYITLFNLLQKNANVINTNKYNYKQINGVDYIENKKFNTIMAYLNLSNKYNKIEINLEKIFNNTTCNEDIVFIKYRNSIKNEYYKIYNNLTVNTQKKINKELKHHDFKDYDTYYVKFKKNQSIIELLDEEAIYNFKAISKTWKYDAHEHVREENINKIEALSLQINLKEIIGLEFMFCLLKIFNNGVSQIVILPKQDSHKITNDILIEIYKKINSVISNLTDKIDGINIKTLQNIKYIAVNEYATINFNKPISISKIKTGINKYYSVVNIDKKEPNKLYIIYQKIDNYSSYNNLKFYLNKIRSEKPEYSIEDLKELWIKSTNKYYNISSIDSLKLLDLLIEDLNEEPKVINDNVEIEIESGELNTQLLFTIKNSTDFKTLDTINELMNSIFYTI